MRLIDQYKHWHKMWSVRLAMGAGVFASWAVSQPAQVQVALSYFPDKYRPVAGLLVGLVTFAAPTITRLAQQNNLPPQNPGGGNAGQ